LGHKRRRPVIIESHDLYSSQFRRYHGKNPGSGPDIQKTLEFPFKRFQKPTEMMGYTGLVPSEYSSGGRESKGGLTRTGNAHLRHVLGEAAWHARHRPWLNLRMKKVLPMLPAGVAEIAWKAQERLHHKFTKMTYCRKHPGKVASAVARELVGFVWAIGTLVESGLDGDRRARA